MLTIEHSNTRNKGSPLQRYYKKGQPSSPKYVEKKQ